MKKLFIVILVVVVAGAGIFLYNKKRAERNRVQYTEIKVERGDLTEKALAVGKIDPDHEIVIKSQISGIVDKIYREVGEHVKEGEPLLLVKPEPTPIELATAQRQLELAELNSKFFQNDQARAKALFDEKYISGKD